MKRIIYVDPTKCRGCGRCSMVCSFVHDGVFNFAASRIRLSRLSDRVCTVPVVCQQCEAPYCTFACPTGAIQKDDNSGVVKIDPEICVSCLMCFLACPLGGISLSPDRLPIKCDLCDGEPQCALICDYGAIQYVDIEQANSLKAQKGVMYISDLEA